MSANGSQASATDETAKLPPDWDLAKVLYAQGFPIKTIATQCRTTPNAVAKRVTRQNWVALKSGLRRSVAVELSGAEIKTLPDTSAVVRNRLAGELLRASEGLDSLKRPRSVRERSERGKMVKDLADPAKIVFGWEDKAAGSQVNINLMASMTVAKPEDKPAIEIESQPVQGEAVTPEGGS